MTKMPADDDLAAARRRLRESRLNEHIQRVVDEAPPLTEGQIDKLCSLFRSTDRATPKPAPAKPADPIVDAARARAAAALGGDEE